MGSYFLDALASRSHCTVSLIRGWFNNWHDCSCSFAPHGGLAGSKLVTVSRQHVGEVPSWGCTHAVLAAATSALELQATVPYATLPPSSYHMAYHFMDTALRYTRYTRRPLLPITLLEALFSIAAESISLCFWLRILRVGSFGLPISELRQQPLLIAKTIMPSGAGFEGVRSAVFKCCVWGLRLVQVPDSSSQALNMRGRVQSLEGLCALLAAESTGGFRPALGVQAACSLGCFCR